MEIKARYVLIGLFTLAVIVAGFAFVYWLETTGGVGKRTNYEIRFHNTVSGPLDRLGGAVQRHPRRRGDRARLVAESAERDGCDNRRRCEHADARGYAGRLIFRA